MNERRQKGPRSNPLLFESDGDFNPGWLLFIGFSGIGALISLGSLVAAVMHAEAWPAVVAALSFTAFAMLCTAIIVVPIAKAKLLTRLKNAPGDIASAATGGAGGRLTGVDFHMTDDERGEP